MTVVASSGRTVRRERWHGVDVLSYAHRPSSIIDMLDRAVREHGSRVGMVADGEQCTYAEFADRVAGTVAVLRSRGLDRGSALGVVGHNSVDLAVLVFACAAAGVTMIGLSERDAPPRWASLLRTADARAVAATARHFDAAHTAARLAGVHAVHDLRTLTSTTGIWTPVAVDESETYAVVGTAGTTGTPKASRVIHRCSVHSALSYLDVLGLGRDDRTAVLFPLTYISALHAHVLPTMLAGGISVFATDSQPHRFARLLADQAITWMYTVPSLWMALLRVDSFNGRNLPALRVAAFGGSHFPPDLVPVIRQRLPRVALHNVYGLSETHSPATILRDHEFADRPTSVGKPLPCMQARVVDADGAVLAADVEGELQLRGSLVTTGYLRDTGATAAAFTTDGWFRTGDHARIDDEGYVWILGRRQDLIVRGGFNIAPVELERVLRRHPGIDDVAVYGVPDRVGDRAVACAVVRTDPELKIRDVRDWVRRYIADYAVPRHVDFVDDLPMTVIGKIDRAALIANATRKDRLQ